MNFKRPLYYIILPFSLMYCNNMASMELVSYKEPRCKRDAILNIWKICSDIRNDAYLRVAHEARFVHHNVVDFQSAFRAEALELMFRNDHFRSNCDFLRCVSYKEDESPDYIEELPLLAREYFKENR